VKNEGVRNQALSYDKACGIKNVLYHDDDPLMLSKLDNNT
jgi:hypothetical protein